jgi:uncharacterized protein YukE
MGVRTFPALGFDPAPGVPAALHAQARAADRAARALAGAATAADRLTPQWEGAAAEAFRAGTDPLPGDLGRAAAAHGTLARELSGYAQELVGRQRRAAELESRAAALATGRSPVLVDELEAVIAAARRLLGEHRAEAARAAARIRAAASDPPYRSPGLLARIEDRVRGWVAAHADTLGAIAGDLRGVSMVAGTVSLVPGFAFLAPVAVAAGSVAIGLEAAVVAATGRGSWSGLALDATVTVLPTGPSARLVRAVPGVARGLKAVNRAVPAGARGWIFRATRTLPEGITAEQLAAAAARIRSGAHGLSADVVVQGSRAAHSARAASDVDVGLRVSPQRYEQLLRECFGDAPAREAATNAAERGRIFWRHAGLGPLHHALEEDLGRKVDLAIIKQGGRFDNEPWVPVR